MTGMNQYGDEPEYEIKFGANIVADNTNISDENQGSSSNTGNCLDGLIACIGVTVACPFFVCYLGCEALHHYLCCEDDSNDNTIMSHYHLRFGS